MQSPSYEEMKALLAAALPQTNGKLDVNGVSGGSSGGTNGGGIAGTLWIDAANAYWIRRDITAADGSVSVVFTNPTGTVGTPSGALRPSANEESIHVSETLYSVTTAGTGYAVGDVLARVVATDDNPTTPVVLAAYWLNLNSGAIIASPTMANLAVLNSNAALLTAIALVSTKLQTLIDDTSAATVSVTADAIAGTVTDLAWTGTGVSTEIALLRGIWAKLDTLVTDTTGATVEGTTAHDAAMGAVKPIAAGARAAMALPSPVQDGDLTHLMTDKYGRMIARPVLRENVVRGYSTAITAAAPIIPADATYKQDLYKFIVTNHHATNTVRVDLLDDATVVDSYEIGPKSYGGFCVGAGEGIPQATVNKAWNYTTTGTAADISVSALAVKASV